MNAPQPRESPAFSRGEEVNVIVCGVLTIHHSRRAAKRLKVAERNWKRAEQNWKVAEQSWKRAAIDPREDQ